MKKLIYILFVLSLLIMVSSCAPKEVHEHIYNAVVTDYTCSERGYTTYTCECGQTSEVTIPKLEAHEWDEGTVTTEATHFSTGVKTYMCGCGETKTDCENYSI